MDAIENMNLQTVKVHMKKQHRSLMMRRLLANKSMVFGSIIVLILVIAAIAAPYITKYDPYEMTVADRLKAPDTNHWFGTDNFGRDIFSRTLYGAQVSMGVGFAVALATSAMGLVIGLYASYYRIPGQYSNANLRRAYGFPGYSALHRTDGRARSQCHQCHYCAQHCLYSSSSPGCPIFGDCRPGADLY